MLFLTKVCLLMVWQKKKNIVSAFCGSNNHFVLIICFFVSHRTVIETYCFVVLYGDFRNKIFRFLPNHYIWKFHKSFKKCNKFQLEFMSYSAHVIFMFSLKSCFVREIPSNFNCRLCTKFNPINWIFKQSKRTTSPHPLKK